MARKRPLAPSMLAVFGRLTAAELAGCPKPRAVQRQARKVPDSEPTAGPIQEYGSPAEGVVSEALAPPAPPTRLTFAARAT